MPDSLSSKAYLDLFLWWAAEFDAAQRFYTAWSTLPSTVAPDDYDWSAASTAAERLLVHVPATLPEALCLIEVLIDQLDDRADLAAPLRTVQGFLAQGALSAVVGPAPSPAVVDYVSEAA